MSFLHRFRRNLVDSSKCEGCPLDGTTTPVEPTIVPGARFLVVTDTPTEAAARRGALLSKSPMSALAKGMGSVGFYREDFSFSASIRCAHDAGMYRTVDKKLIARKCRAHLEDDILASRPEVILPLGAAPASCVMGRGVKITKARGVVTYSEEHQTHVMPLLSPGQVVMYPQHESTFRADCESLRRLVDHEYDSALAGESMLGEYQIVDDLQFLLDQEPQLVVFDMECTGLKHFERGSFNVRNYDPAMHSGLRPDAAILTMQFCIKPGEAYMVVWDHPEAPASPRAKSRLKRQIAKLLCRRKVRVVGQNLKFDAKFLYAHTGIRIKVGGDTLMLAALVDENLQSKSLDVLTKIYAPEMGGYADHFNATTDKSRMWEVPLQKMSGYGCGDVDACYRVYKTLMPMVQEDAGSFANYRHVSLPGINAFTSIELRGIPVDYDALLAFEQIMAESVAEQEAALLAQVPASIKRLHVDKGAKKGESGCKFTRASFVIDILFRHKDGFRLKPKVFTPGTAKLDKEFQVPSVSSKDHLPFFFEECPFTLALAEYIKDERLLSTSIRGFKDKYIFDDLVRSTYALWVAVTGRTSCIRGDVPVTTTRGEVRADEVVVGDYVWTHHHRWMPVTNLYRKPVTPMYDVRFSNGEVLTCTADHIVLLNTGEWATLRSIIERGVAYAEHIEGAHEGPCTRSQGSGGVQGDAQDSAAGSLGVRGKPCDCEGYDSSLCIAGGLQKVRTLQVSRKQAGRKEPSVWATVGGGLRGWSRVPDEIGGGCEVLRSPDSICRASRDSCASTTGEYAGTPHRREQEEQLDRQLSGSYCQRSPANPRPLSGVGAGPTIEEIDSAGSHRVYDFEVAEDHSYLSCGVFSHNSEDPNGQNFPKRGAKAKAYRRIFRAPDGHYVLEADLSQAELRIAADMSRDPTMCAIYAAAGDIHTATALIVVGMSADEFSALDKATKKRFRTSAKAVNFGFIYGMWWRKFVGYAKTQYGVDFTDKQAEAIREGFFRKYFRLEGWHKSMKAFAHKNGFVRSYSGRVRHLPMIDSEDDGVKQEAERQAVNSPVQNFGSDLGVMATGRIDEEVDDTYLAPIAFVHDAIYALVPSQHLEWGAKTLKWYLESNPIYDWFGIDMVVPIVADVSFGLNFGDVYEMEGLTLDEDYDFSKFWDAEKAEGIRVPPQSIPPNDGLRASSLYTVVD